MATMVFPLTERQLSKFYQQIRNLKLLGNMLKAANETAPEGIDAYHELAMAPFSASAEVTLGEDGSVTIYSCAYGYDHEAAAALMACSQGSGHSFQATYNSASARTLPIVVSYDESTGVITVKGDAGAKVALEERWNLAAL